MKLVSDGIKEEADRLGVNLIFCYSEIDAAKALACAQDFKAREVQGVLNFQVFQESSPEICAAHGDVSVIAIDIIQPPARRRSWAPTTGWPASWAEVPWASS